jgi:hypothetical protein
MNDTTLDLQAQVARLEAENAKLRAALTPFAEAGRTMGRGFKTPLAYQETDGLMYTLYRDDYLNPLNTDDLVQASDALPQLEARHDR